MHALNFYLHSHSRKTPFMYSTIITEIFLPVAFGVIMVGVLHGFKCIVIFCRRIVDPCSTAL